MDLRLKGRRTLIVGGSYGIGLATARLMAEEGASLALVSRNADNLATAADEIERAGAPRPAELMTADVTRSGEAERVAELIGERWGALDCLISAVGGSFRSAFTDLADSDWLKNYELNVLSTVRTVRATLPLLRKGEAPSIVLLGAAAAKMPHTHQVVSNVHKAGLLGLNKTLAGELAPEGIRVNLVGPGRTRTPLWLNRADEMAAARGITAEEVIAEFSREIPMGRFGTPEEIGVMVAWLASPRASYVTGQAVNVDGGIARGLL